MNVYQEGQLEKLKIVIWDLDETFWEGTIDNGDNPVIPDTNIELIKTLTDCGIVNSICSKNSFEIAKSYLIKNKIWDLFVFPSINWNAKGQRVKNILDEMGLRPVNALFIDDNHLNIEEVEFCVPGIITAFPDVIDSLLKEARQLTSRIDVSHKRLKQYKVLEKKAAEKTSFNTSKDFLMSCQITLNIHNNCVDEKSRIFELIHRSNQLNFTKIRCSEEELDEILSDSSYQCGTVWVSDRFGDYGMVGFYAIKDGRAEHFLFSCRTIGMGVEQYVYQILGCPTITVVGEVVAELGSTESMEWINAEVGEAAADEAKSLSGREHSVLIKGPCDMEQMFNFIKKTNVIDSEFTHVDRKSGVALQGSQHTVQILESLTLTAQEKKGIAEELPFASDDFFDTCMFSGDYDYVFLSLLHESHLGIYKRKSDGVKVVFGEAAYPMTDEKFFDEYEKGTVYTGGCKLSRSFLEWFAEHYEFCGHTSVEELRQNLIAILEHLKPTAKLVLMLGVEYPCEIDTNPAFKYSHMVFAEQNSMIRLLAQDNDRIDYIYYGDYLNGQDGFYNNIYHFEQKVYYNIANIVVEIVNKNGLAIDTFSSRRVNMVEMRKKLMQNPLLGLAKKLKNIHRKIR